MRRPLVEMLESALRHVVPSRVPQAWTCAEVLDDPRKLHRLTEAAFNELVGMEASQRKIGDDVGEILAVREHYPGGPEEVVPLVREACSEAKLEDKAFVVAVLRLRRPVNDAR
jgi:hypothetical protein